LSKARAKVDGLKNQGLSSSNNQARTRISLGPTKIRDQGKIETGFCFLIEALVNIFDRIGEIALPAKGWS